MQRPIAKTENYFYLIYKAKPYVHITQSFNIHIT